MIDGYLACVKAPNQKSIALKVMFYEFVIQSKTFTFNFLFFGGVGVIPKASHVPGDMTITEICPVLNFDGLTYDMQEFKYM